MQTLRQLIGGDELIVAPVALNPIMPTRDEEQLPTREEALRFYTLGSAWFTFDDEKRGSLKAGKLADLAVLTRDYLTTPTGDIGATESLLTMVGGRIVYAVGPFAQFEEKRPASP